MKYLKYLFTIGIIISALIFTINFFVSTNKKSVIDFKTEKIFTTTIENNIVVTGKIIPKEEVELKPQISGIIDKIFVEEGDRVKAGDIIAKIRVVPNEQNLNASKGRVKKFRISLETTEKEFLRNKDLFQKGIISDSDFLSFELQYNQAKQDLINAENDLKIIKEGSIGGSSSANTDIRATVPGTVLEIPVEEGDQVIESNSFNSGTTIAAIADLNRMIFEGQVDETDVILLKAGSEIKVSLGAINNQSLTANLRFIAPKGIDQQGSVKFKIEADLILNKEINIKAGYSANASITLQRKENVSALKESVIQFDEKTQTPFVEIKIDNQTFDRRDVKLGISDGINVELYLLVSLNLFIVIFILGGVAKRVLPSSSFFEPGSQIKV